MRHQVGGIKGEFRHGFNVGLQPSCCSCQGGEEQHLLHQAGEEAPAPPPECLCSGVGAAQMVSGSHVVSELLFPPADSRDPVLLAD